MVWVGQERNAALEGWTNLALSRSSEEERNGLRDGCIPHLQGPTHSAIVAVLP